MSLRIDLTHEASDAGARSTRNPEIGRASVEDDLELLRGCSDRDRRIVLRVHVVYLSSIDDPLEIRQAHRTEEHRGHP